eukprot:58486-Prorocentrum_minimum.AAC.2
MCIRDSLQTPSRPPPDPWESWVLVMMRSSTGPRCGRASRASAWDVANSIESERIEISGALQRVNKGLTAARSPCPVQWQSVTIVTNNRQGN